MRGRVSEGMQRADEASAETTALGAQPLRGSGTAERLTRKIGEQTRRAGDPLPVGETDEAPAAALANDARTRQPGIEGFQVQERRGRQIGDRRALGRVSDFQDIVTAIGGSHPEVLITLARQPRGARLDAVALAHEADCAR